jgi:Rrf2 family protein
MIFSNPVQYAIRAMTYLGEQEVGKLSSIREISRAADIPEPYLAKIINRLSRRRLVIAKRGPSGGVMLGRPASRITVDEIVNAMGGRFSTRKCVLGFEECNDQTPCPVHDSWKTVRQSLTRTLHDKSVTDLVRARQFKVALLDKP